MPLIVSETLTIPLRKVVDDIVDFLRKEAATFDDVIAEDVLANGGEGPTTRFAVVKRRTIQAMADRIEKRQWFEVAPSAPGVR